ncbi:PD-(D/E)XK motif protein [Spiroplasma cantharicola]|uniref:Uncharacterized protein n=1 Tax=Spiroplasma cantharicola TaxID=362837 RepID=A0A0M4K1S2_9MOLU|nr:PD-(D/E)XK motif protein [Spiroplasma cantharicola]ALD66600.1 hypothetical protein SCANT_v1c06940 [Spiroplasma cantharicola]
MLNYKFIEENIELNLRLLKNDFGDLIIEKKSDKLIKEKKYENYKYWEYFCTNASSNEQGEIDSYITEIIKINKINGDNLISEQMTLKLFKIIENLMSERPDHNLYSIIKDCENLFERQKRILKEEKLFGFFGELILLDKFCSIYPNAEMWWHRKDYMEFDFYINEKKEYLEVKANSIFKDNYLIKLDQISDTNPYLAGVSFKEDGNGKNIMYFISKFINSKNEFLKEFIEDLSSIVKDYPRNLDYKINVDKIKIRIFDKKDFPLINQQELDERIKKVQYNVDANRIKSYSAEEFIKEVLDL